MRQRRCHSDDATATMLQRRCYGVRVTVAVTVVVTVTNAAILPAHGGLQSSGHLRLML